ncbi:hypothetical protein V8G54_019584, partial [Vigna mungo]
RSEVEEGTARSCLITETPISFVCSISNGQRLFVFVFRHSFQHKQVRRRYRQIPDLERRRRRKRENEGSSRRENSVHEEEEAQRKLFWYSHHLALFTLLRLLYSKFRTSLLLRFRKHIKENVEGFNVFRNSASVAQSSGEVQADQESIELCKKKNKKEQNRQLERDAIFRKQHNIHVSGYNVPSPLQSFDELKSRYKCPSYLLRNLKELGFREPTPIQRQTIPVLLDGRECFACAPTGSGKTLAFVCPMLMKLKDPEKGGIRAVILCHTRELSAQIFRECKKLAKRKKFGIKLMTKSLLRNADFSKFPCDILISTPLRLRLAIKKKKIDLSRHDD